MFSRNSHTLPKAVYSQPDIYNRKSSNYSGSAGIYKFREIIIVRAYLDAEIEIRASVKRLYIDFQIYIYSTEP